jgi:cellobiose epimerase
MASKEDLQTLFQQADQEARTNILPFWLKLLDPTFGGFYGEVSFSGEVRKQADKGGVLCARLAWTFSNAYLVYRDPAYLDAARQAYRFLTGPFWDAEQGGTYWSVDYQGRPVDTRKMILAQSFTIYALTKYYQATREPAALAKAIQLFNLIETHSRDAKFGGYLDAFDQNWNLIEPDPKVAKGMDPHLRLLMAFTALLRVWESPVLRQRLTEMAAIFLDRMINAQTNHLILFLTADWRPTSQDFSYGHDIELVWLLSATADALGDEALRARITPAMLRMAEEVYRSGLDADGAIFDKAGPGGLLTAEKVWWPQAESVVGFLNAYQLSGEEKYFQAAQRNWQWIRSFLVNREHGDWYAQLDPDHRPVEGRDLVDFWKCPYHNGRCCFEVMGRMDRLMGGL